MGYADRAKYESNFTQLAREHAMTRGALVQFLMRGFFGRLKWLVTGR